MSNKGKERTKIQEIQQIQQNVSQAFLIIFVQCSLLMAQYLDNNQGGEIQMILIN